MPRFLSASAPCSFSHQWRTSSFFMSERNLNRKMTLIMATFSFLAPSSWVAEDTRPNRDRGGGVVEIPAFVHETLTQPTFWQFATINPDGSPAVTPVWIDVDGEHVLVNTAIGRRKERNARREPRVALGFVDRDEPYTWIELRGRVVEFVEGEVADASIDRL